MRFRLRTLLIVVAVGPPALWLVWLGASHLVKQFEYGPDIPLFPFLATAVVGAAAIIYLFVPPPGRGQPTLWTLLIALAVLFFGLLAIGLIEKLIGGFDYNY
jgi:hypothetical protein